MKNRAKLWGCTHTHTQVFLQERRYAYYLSLSFLVNFLKRRLQVRGGLIG